MTISMNMVPEETIEECKRHVDECAALLERTSDPEDREAPAPIFHRPTR